MPSTIPMRGVRVADDLYQKASFVAKENNRSFNQQCVYLLRRMVAEYESQHGPIPVHTSAQDESALGGKR